MARQPWLKPLLLEANAVRQSMSGISGGRTLGERRLRPGGLETERSWPDILSGLKAEGS